MKHASSKKNEKETEKSNLKDSNHLKDKSLFLKTLKDLSVTSIHLDGFEPEQIFYQLEESTKTRFNFLKNEINLKFKKSEKQAALRQQNNKKTSKEESVSSEQESNFEGELSEELDSNGDSNLIGDSDSELDMEVDNESNSDQSSSLKEDDESTISIDPDFWNASNSSDLETLNKPACEVANMLWDKKSKKTYKK
jgi:hypothetical protein